jgi:hypothetical protein
MSKLITLSIDVTKINKEKLYKGTKGVYLNVDCWIDEDADEDWKKVSLNQSLSKEEREAKEKKTFIGNGKLVFGWDQAAPSGGGGDITEEEVPF